MAHAANRRVSFAPEATLHTWNVVEIPDDSTSSSASNSTRRASSLAGSENKTSTPSAAPQFPSSPDADTDSEFGFSPVRQQDLQQMADRSASSGGPEGPRDLSSSPFSGSSASGSEDTGAPSLLGEGELGSDDGFDAESTAMSMQSDASSSSRSSARLNDALQQAAREAGTRAIGGDSDGEMSMEIADQEITGAFQPWIKKGQRQSFDWEDISARHDQENIDPSKGGPSPAYTESDGVDDDDRSMDVTNAVGRILGNPPAHRQSTARRNSSETNYDDQTMEMTNMIGGIAPNANENEGMTMEVTSVVGGVLSKDPSQSRSADTKSGRKSIDWSDGENESDEGMEMEMTGAIGGILPPGLETGDKAQAKKLMELESDSGQLASSPFQENVGPSPPKSPAKSPLAFQVAAVASESGSPSLANVRSRPSRRSSTLGASSVPGSARRQRSPAKKPSTPSKQATPHVKPTTPNKTPPSSNVTFRSASPKKLFQPEIQQSTEKAKSTRQSIFEHNAATGESTPLFVLQPREGRRSSGLGIDKEGLGSPRVAALLDKRLSLGENTPQFVPQERPRAGVRFEDPLKLQAEEECDREEEELREDGHISPGRSTDKDVTSSLKDMISSLSPKKVGSRKSLHVGAARGILGKRPIELDLEEEETENSPKRLRGRDVSPVKGVRLPPPTSKDEIRSPGRTASCSPRKNTATPGQEPRKASKSSTTPLKEGIDSLHIASDPQQPEQEDVPSQESDAQVEPIHLQDFLNMTNIHFMELTTTKRRHTTAPGSAKKKMTRISGENMPKTGSVTFDDCVAVGFCTVPMLELYQHVRYPVLHHGFSAHIFHSSLAGS